MTATLEAVEPFQVHICEVPVDAPSKSSHLHARVPAEPPST